MSEQSDRRHAISFPTPGVNFSMLSYTVLLMFLLFFSLQRTVQGSGPKCENYTFRGESIYLTTRQLYSYLFNNREQRRNGPYNKLIRPVANESDVPRIKIELKLTQIIDVVSIIYSFDF